MAWNEIRHRAQLVQAYADIGAVWADESRLGQVFLNLIVNAAQAIAVGHADANQIRIATRIDDAGRVVVEIGDTGAGMPPEVVRRLFTPFFTTKAPGLGTGLGLSICHRIVSELGGEITVQSAIGVGTTFSVFLPMTASESAPAVVVAPVVPAAVRRARVLVVDDDVDVGRAVTRSLQHVHEVTLFTRASDALARIAAGERFDVILCDLMMPEMTGMALHDAIREISADQADRMIFLTGGTFTEEARAFLDHTKNTKLEKPFSVQSLLAIVSHRVSG